MKALKIISEKSEEEEEEMRKGADADSGTFSDSEDIVGESSSGGNRNKKKVGMKIMNAQQVYFKLD